MSLLITSRITVKINYIMYGNKKNYHKIYMVETLPFREYIEH